MEIADRYGVGVAEGDGGDQRRRPRSDAADPLEPGPYLRRWPIPQRVEPANLVGHPDQCVSSSALDATAVQIVIGQPGDGVGARQDPGGPALRRARRRVAEAASDHPSRTGGPGDLDLLPQDGTDDRIPGPIGPAQTMR